MASWTDQENDLIVADYFAMLRLDLTGSPFNKSEHNRRIQAATGRSRGAVEYKYANVSAALKAFGQPLLGGYLPRFNFQMSLSEAVARWLKENPDWTMNLPKRTRTGLEDQDHPIFIETAPTRRNTPEPIETEQMQTIARRFDVAGLDERNRLLGEAGEKQTLIHERSVLVAAGRDDLAKKVTWISKEEGDGAGYDILSFTPNGTPRLIEVKTTNGWDRTPFHISRNELRVADENRETWHLFRLYNFVRGPRAFELRPPLSAHVALTPTSFQASFS